MKKIVKFFLLLIFIFAISCFGHSVEANSIKSISMDIYVDKNGNAKVTEVWNCDANQGTEVYHPYYNLGESEIQNFSVSESSTSYSVLSSWHTSASFSEKAYKCGINYIEDGVELCWGISKYGKHTYTVNYEITNFVSSLTDSQMIYWTLIPHNFSNEIGKAYIKIHTDFNIPNTVDVWGYGNYGGTAYVYDGYIEMQSDGVLQEDEYMTILVKFPLGTFNTSNTLNNDFQYYYNMAQEGSTAYVSSSTSYFFDFILPILVGVVIGIICIVAVIAIYCETPRYNFKLSKDEKKSIPYFRDIPCKGDLLRAYYIASKYKFFKNKTDILGAFILKWLKDGLVRIEQKETGLILKKDNSVIVFNKTGDNLFTNQYEQQMFNIMYKASKDGILENKEFERWCQNNYSTILNLFDKIIDKEQQKCINDELISVETVKSFKFFTRKEYNATSELKEQVIQLMGLKQYLNDYTLIKDREAIEVHLFEEYLIYAQMLGIAKKVAKQFKDLYPEVIEQSCYNSYDNIIFINMCASHGIAEANSAKARAESYSSGGGGFSSGGGGGGSFGGGGGGGGFR